MQPVFDSSFFYDEVRIGFYISSMMKRCWGAMIVVLNDVIEICKKYDIKMYVTSGTALGAVRHKGFIPWDDDLDICIWREDLKRFSDAMNRELSGSYKVLECDSQQYNYLEPWYRIVNSVNIIRNPETLDKFCGFMYPVGVDVYILDNMPDNAEEISVLRGICNIAYYSFYENEGQKEDEELAMDRLKRCAEFMEELTHIEIDRSDIRVMRSQIMKYLQILVSMYPADSDNVVMLCAAEYAATRYKRDWFDEVVYTPFENIDVPVPKEYDLYVRALYGDYHRIIRGGSSHEYPSYLQNEKAVEKGTGSSHLYDPSKETIGQNGRRNVSEGGSRVIFFLPYRASSWSFFDSEYKKAVANRDNTVVVMPIPFFNKHYTGRLEDEVYSSEGYPEDVHITKLSEINIEAYDIDEIYIQCPFDERNTAMSVHPYFYSPHLRQMCKRLTYIPDFELSEFSSKEDVSYSTLEFFLAMPGPVYCDRMIVQSENMKKMFTEYLCEWSGEEFRDHWNEKLECRASDG